MISNKKAEEGARTIAEYCKEQASCQNCIFREYGSSAWTCQIGAFYIQDVISNIDAKRKNHGYL